MFCLNVALGNIAWRLIFENQENCNKACEHLNDEIVSIDDDFGQMFRAPKENISGWLAEDMEKTKLAHIELSLHFKRIESMTTKRAQNDQGLRADMLTRQTPAIFSPMGNNGRPPF